MRNTLEDLTINMPFSIYYSLYFSVFFGIFRPIIYSQTDFIFYLCEMSLSIIFLFEHLKESIFFRFSKGK